MTAIFIKFSQKEGRKITVKIRNQYESIRRKKQHEYVSNRC